MPLATSAALFDWAERVSALARAATPFFLLIDFEGRRPRLFTAADWESRKLHFDFPARQDPHGGETSGTRPVHLTAQPPRPDAYRAAFERVQAGLRRGDSFLTNLTFASPVELRGTLLQVYRQTEAKYRVHLPGEFTCFSPETFVSITADGYLETRPMKGTAADTPAGRAALLSSRKEIAEHATIVDLLRNDLSQVARRVRVTDYRYLRTIASARGGLVQTSSRIGGQLPEDWRASLGQTLLRLLPAGSVSGAPKPATLELIHSVEQGPRGYYCGVAGYYDGHTLDSCVLIRMIVRRPTGAYYFHSGGGVTALSDWREEYDELISKIRLPLYLARPPR